ncbi:MAG: hypothetical protein V4648_00980, partial [Bacteroidota bacterium]
MKKLTAYKIFIGCCLVALSLTLSNCKKKDEPNRNNATFEATAIADFFAKYPKLNTYQKQVTALYEDEQQHYIWFDDDG